MTPRRHPAPLCPSPNRFVTSPVLEAIGTKRGDALNQVLCLLPCNPDALRTSYIAVRCAPVCPVLKFCVATSSLRIRVSRRNSAGVPSEASRSIALPAASKGAGVRDFMYFSSRKCRRSTSRSPSVSRKMSPARALTYARQIADFLYQNYPFGDTQRDSKLISPANGRHIWIHITSESDGSSK